NDQGTRASYVVSDTSKYRTLVVPNFVPEFVQAQNIRRGWAEQKLYIAETGANRLNSHEIKLPAHEGVSSFRRSTWTPDGAHLLVDRMDRDTKRRQLYYVRNAGTAEEKVILVTEETDDKWQAPLSNIFEPHPTDPNTLFFASERDGYSHLYLATVNPEAGTANIRQLTNGNWQVEWARWTNAGQILYSSTEAGYTGRELYLLDPASGRKGMLESPEKGMKDNFVLSENKGEQTVVFEHSKWNQPGDIYAQRVCSPCSKPNAPIRLTNTVPKEFMARKWQVPQFIEIDSSDGKKIPAKIYLPAGFNKQKKYPMAIFVHGAGYLQNVINGWNNYYREFMFNQLLTQRGYVVLDIDYRGSAGYGRDWRTDVHDFLGGKDYDDHIDSIDHMVANYAVDPTKVGVYGGSYGGFMAGMLVMRAPDKIAAAAALRSVFDWKNYYATNPGYTAQRLGFPDKNAEAYKRSSPITYAEQLERPLLILHGMVDDNVHVQDSIQLIEKLIRLGKTKHFEAMMYPSESHAFVRPESWADEYERIQWFFERHLENR
ncbi:MAG: S9 family peptidase, partial [Blastocatellia bacterium]|nr:S9 family peptidase [Blastocatellia bacterium]